MPGYWRHAENCADALAILARVSGGGDVRDRRRGLACAFILPGNEKLGPWAESPLIAAIYAVAAVALARLVYVRRRAGTPGEVRTATLATVAFMVLTCTGIVTNERDRRSLDQQTPILQLKQQLPPGRRLVSLGHIDALFAYYYAEPIEAIGVFPLNVSASDVPDDDNVYFAFDTYVGFRPNLPFTWTEVDAIPMDRYKWPPPEREVVIGHRLKTSPP